MPSAPSTPSSSPLATHTATVDRLNLFGIRCGIHLFQPTRRVSFRARGWIALLIALVASWAYTSCVADAATVWRSTTFLPFMLQGLGKFHAFIAHGPRILAQLAHVRHVYEQNARPRPARQTTADGDSYSVLQRWSGRIERFTRCVCLAIGVTGALFVLVPVWTFWRTGEVTMVLDHWIVGVDRHTPSGYAVHLAFHLATVLVAYWGTVCSDMMMVLLTVHVWPMAEIWCGMVRRLDRALLAQRRGRGVGESFGGDQRIRGAHRQLMRRILLVHGELDAYVRRLSEIFECFLFVEYYTLVAMSCLLTYCLLVVSVGWRLNKG